MERGMAKENSRKEKRMVQEIMHLWFLMGNESLFVPFVEILDMLKTPAEPEKEQWRIPHNPERKKPRNGRQTSLKKLNPLQLQHKKQRLPVPPRRMIMMMISLISMISWMLLSNLMINLKRNQLEKARENVVIVIMILVIIA
jgi:hypothetical protein